MDAAKSSAVTDDQELAKVLESMNQQASTPVLPPIDDEPVKTDAPKADAAASDGLSFEETPATDAPAADSTTSDSTIVDASADPVVEAVAEPVVEPIVAPIADGVLDSIKKDALEELRPLVDKLDLPADEKFDTLLLLIRSTDDKTLVSAAHEAAKEITDEAKRAQALLDVIKEIDYFSAQK